MTKDRFLKELFRAFALGTLLFLGFTAYRYFTAETPVEYSLSIVWKD